MIAGRLHTVEEWVASAEARGDDKVEFMVSDLRQLLDLVGELYGVIGDLLDGEPVPELSLFDSVVDVPTGSVL